MSKTPKQQTDKAWQGKLIEKLIIFLSWLPLGVVRLLGILLGSIFYWLPNSSKRVAKINIATALPHLSTVQQKQLLKTNLKETSKVFLELGAMWRWPEDKLLGLIKEVKGQELLDQAVAQGKGVIFIAPHIGNWELIGPYLSSKYPSTFLYRPPNVASVEEFMVKSRGRFGAKLAPTDARGVRTLMKALSNNEVSVILPDQDPGATGGVYAPFFDHPARTMTLLSKLMQKTDCAAVLVVMKRLPGLSGGFALHVIPADEEVKSEDVLQATTALNRGVEQCVEIAPEQYLWTYKRYRKPPEGVVDIYKK